MGWVVRTYKCAAGEDEWIARGQVVPYIDETDARKAASAKILPHLRHYDPEADIFYWYQEDGLSRTGYRAEVSPVPPDTSAFLDIVARSLLI